MQEEPYSLTGQKVLIIGGSSRMGLEIAQLSAKLGAAVILSSLSKSKLDAAIASLPEGVTVYPANAAIALMTNPAVTNTVIDVDSGERLGTWSGAASERLNE